MSRTFGILVGLMLAGPAAANQPSVADLVKQLGDAKFARREAAQKELLGRGEGIVPELDRLAKTADAETADRIGKVRYALVGYKDDIRRLLTEVHEGKDSGPVPVSDELRGLIERHQPGSGDLLVAILAQPNHRLYRRALRTIVATWDAATPDQIEAYIRGAVTLKSTHRPKFPAKVGALISVEAQLRDGWTGWPPLEGEKKFDFRCRTTRFVDGKPYEKPFECPFPFATVGWYKVGELAEGKHTIHAVLEYEFTQRGEKRKGEIRSKESSFEVVSADTPDTLVAPSSEKMSKAVRHSLRVREPKSIEQLFDGTPREAMMSDPEPPQVSWESAAGRRASLHCPVWELTTPLDVDLCFDVEIHDVKTGKVYPADAILVRRGQKSKGYIYPREVRAFANDNAGTVKVKVLLKPSRALALSDTGITTYFAESIETGELRLVVRDYPIPAPRKRDDFE